jgi:hypothetical protein
MTLAPEDRERKGWMDADPEFPNMASRVTQRDTEVESSI